MRPQARDYSQLRFKTSLVFANPTQCYVEEPLAGELATRFLRSFLKRQTVGAALFDARRSLLLDRGPDTTPRPDPRGLAYSLFASADVQLRQAVIS